MARPQGNPKPFDNTHIPPAARRAAEEAQRLQEQLTSQGKPQDPEPEPQSEPQPEPQPQPTNPEPQPEPEQKPPARAENPDDESWKQKFESERGRLQAARRQIDELSGRVDSMSRLMATMQQPSSAAPPVEEDKQLRFVTPEMEQEWGQDFMSAVEAKAKELIAPLERKLEQKLNSVSSQVATVQEKTFADARRDMMATLDKDLPGWQEQNEDQDFVAWLNLPDTYSGRIRLDMLREAWTTNDASRVAAFFGGYRRENGIVAPQAQPPAPATQPKPSLEKFAAPGVPRSAAPTSGPAEPEYISRRDISRFFADKTAGKFRGKEAEADAYEKKIFEAQAAGRITD